ncbi:MAG: hypothetical protein COB89_07585 [Piscirickettsiaceae bacterium]|nr:MAG: hypothetical protein COB89_07585 [Piscirickettsiaceae bacterium]
MCGKKSETVRIEIDLRKLEQLFYKEVLCARDLRCLDHKSKMLVQSACLTSCAASIRKELKCADCSLFIR